MILPVCQLFTPAGVTAVCVRGYVTVRVQTSSSIALAYDGQSFLLLGCLSSPFLKRTISLLLALLI